MSRWFRYYDDALDDPKVQRLSGDLFKVWVNLLSLASKNEGKLPCADDISFRLRISVQDAQQRVEDLILVGLIDVMPDKSLEPHNWSERQYASDSSAERMRKHRENKKKKACDVTSDGRDEKSDGADTDSETDTDTESAVNSPPEAAEVVAAGGPDEISGLNGSTRMIVEQFANWLNPWNPDLKTAHKSVADAVQIYGPTAVRDGFAELKADHADGKVRALTVKAFYGFVRTAKDRGGKAGPAAKPPNLTAAERKVERGRALLAKLDAQAGV